MSEHPDLPPDFEKVATRAIKTLSSLGLTETQLNGVMHVVMEMAMTTVDITATRLKKLIEDNEGGES